MRAIFLDIETTGLDPRQHHAIDIAFKIVDFNQKQTLITYQSVIQQDMSAWDKRDLASIEVNGYSFEEIINGKSREQIAHEIIRIFSHFQIARGNAFFLCQNPSFDRGFFTQIIDVYTQEKLNWPYHWLDLASMFWATVVQKSFKGLTSLPETLSLSKNDIAKVYQLPPEENPHRAIKGVEHLIQCYEAVLNEKSLHF